VFQKQDKLTNLRPSITITREVKGQYNTGSRVMIFFQFKSLSYMDEFMWRERYGKTQNLRTLTFSNTGLKCTLARQSLRLYQTFISPISMKEYELDHGCLITHVNNIPITLRRHSKNMVPLPNRYSLHLF